MKKEEIQRKIIDAVKRVKAENPMAPSMTNNVTINLVANAQLAVGGAAAMTYLDDEAGALGAMSHGCYNNMGTMMPVYRDTFVKAAKFLSENGKKWVLDPVGVGMGDVRMDILRRMKDYKPAIVRANASEVMALSALWGAEEEGSAATARGVDSTDTVDAAEQAAVSLARLIGGAVEVSGEVDLITDGKTVVRSYGGSKYMEMITGAGCSLGGVTAVYACVADPFTAAVTAANVYNLAGRAADGEVQGPGSFQVRFLDHLYMAGPEDVAANPFDVKEL